MMAELGHAIGFEEWRRLVDSNSWTDFSFCYIDETDLEANTEYMVIVSALIMGNDPARNDFHFRMEEDGTGTAIGDSEARLEPRDSSSLKGEMYFWMDRYTTPSTPARLRMQGRTDGTSAVQRCISFYGVAIKLDDLDARDYEDAENLTNLTGLDDSGWTEGVSITIGDGASDWLVFGYGRTLVDDFSASLLFRLTDDGTIVGEAIKMTGEDNDEVRQWGSMWALEGIASSDVALEFQTDDAVAGTYDIDRCMIFALRLNAFEDYLIDHDPTDTEIAVVDTDYGTISVSHTTDTGGASRDWMLFGASVISKGDNAGTYRHHIRDDTTRIIGDSSDITDGLMQDYAGNTDIVPNVRFGENAAVAHHASLVANIKNQENNDVIPTPDIIDAHMGWFTWELAKPHLPYHNRRHNTLLRM